MNNWYKTSYRRNLVDMHIEDWDPEFLSKFSPEDYVACLKLAHIQSPMIYLQSHVGHCYFPTRVGHMHSALRGREDMMRRLIDLCHAEGMDVVGYYSLIYNTYEEDRHPEWRLMTGADGSSARQRGGRYGNCCPNNPEYREFVAAQIAEISEYFPRLEGMFYDMTFWPGVCHCPHCMEKYAKVGFEEIPIENQCDPNWVSFTHYRAEMMGDFAKFVTETTRKLMPNVTIEHNYANAVASDTINSGTSELVNEQCDYTGGDLYGDLYNHSFTAKYYSAVTKNQPFEYMTCRCDNSLAAHTVTKSEEYLSTEVLLTAAHHGASFVIDAIDPIGTLDRRVYERLGRVFERQMPYEKYFVGKMKTDVGVYYSTGGRYNPHGLPFNSRSCAIGANRALVERHIPVGVAANSTTKQLAAFKLVLAGGIAGLSDENRRDIVEYVKNGGALYMSGIGEPELVMTLLGGELDGFTPETAVYFAPTENGEAIFGEFTPDYPLPTELSQPIVRFAELDRSEVLATMKLPYTRVGERKFASIHSNPPGVLSDIPAIVAKKFGLGRVIWSAAPIENDPRRSHKRLLCELIESFIEPSLRTDAPRQVELTLFETDEGLQLCAVDLLCTDEMLPIRDFTVMIKCDKKPSRVIRVCGTREEDLSFEYSNGSLTIVLKDLVQFAMIRVIQP